MITVQIDETALKADWMAVRNHLQALMTLDSQYGGSLTKDLANIKKKFQKAMQDSVETQIMQDFRGQLGL